MPNSKTVLIVDDDRATLQSISRELQSIGYNTITSNDAAESISVVRNSSPDLIVLDVIFPPDVAHGGGAFTDGFLLVSWLRRMDEAKNIPVVLINGEDSPQQIERARAVGANGFFPKPLNHEGLLAVIVRKLGDPNPPPDSAVEASGSSFSSGT